MIIQIKHDTAGYIKVPITGLLLFFALAANPCGAQTYAIVNTTVIPMDREGSLTDHNVVITNGQITGIGPASEVNIPVGAIVVDGKGKFLIPGLFDMHAHFFYEQGDNVNTCEQELKLMLANGLTTVRIICGDPLYLEARKHVAENKWMGPELKVTSPQFVGRWPWPGKIFAHIVTTPEEAAEAVRSAKAQGYDEIKITFMVERPVYESIMRTAKEAGIPVTGHVGPKVKLPTALAYRQQIEHMDEFIDMLLPDTSYNHDESVSNMNLWRKNAWETIDHLDESKIPALVKMVRDASVFVAPTNYFFFSSFGHGQTDEAYRNKPDYRFIPSRIREDRWKVKEHYWKGRPSEDRRNRYVDIRKKMTRALWKSGVKLMAGSDSPEWFLVQGFSIHDELETFVQCGLTPWAALQTATLHPATYLGIANRTGTVTRGKEADLILLDANPLEDIGNTRAIRSVFVNGIFYNNEGIRKLMEDAASIGR